MAKKDKPGSGAEKPAAQDASDKTVITSIPENAPKTASPVEKGPSVALGTLINNNYRVQELIAAGGMGEVFSGQNVHTDDPVAIKIVLQSLAQDEKVITLFKREARILGQLSDEAIVRYHNFIHDPDLDRYCLIMEFIDGIPLSDYVKQEGPLTLDAAKRLILRLSAGLGKAHKREVTHRDLSPDNVMLRDGDVDQAVLIDFGIAKSTEMSEGTLHGQLAGKFKYISPEQLGHFDGLISQRTDIYGMALLVAATVSGAALDMGSSVVEAVNARRSIPDLSGIYPELRPLLAHMLEPNPLDRPARMLDVVRMVNDPSVIPAKYTGGTGIGQPAAVEHTIITPSMISGGGGLQQPPDAARPVSMPPTGLSDTSESPFGGGSAAPFNAGTMATGTYEQPAKVAKKSNAGFWGAAAIVVALIAGGGWYVMNRGGSVSPPTSNPAPVDVATPATPDTKPLPPPDRTTREGFLAAFKSGECSYSTRVTAGLNAGKVEGFATEVGKFSNLPASYGQAFGAQPSVVERIIEPTQCAALALVRGLQGRAAVAPALTLDTDVMKSGGTVVGRVREARGRPLWLFLVSAQGGVYNLSPRLQAEADGTYTFSFGMSLGQGDVPSPQLIVAVASETALVSAAAGADGADASAFLPLVMAEIEGRGGTAAAAVAYFRLEPL